MYARLFQKTSSLANRSLSSLASNLTQVQYLVSHTNQTKIDALAQYKEKMLNEMIKQYPSILRIKLDGKIAYSLRNIHPEKMIENGGFKSDAPLWLACTGIENTSFGNNDGSICFSLLPEVAAIFKSYKRGSTYLYALPLQGDFLAPGGRWRQIISPGAFALPTWWIARELVEVTLDNRIILGPMMGHLGKMNVEMGERFKEFVENRLVKPQAFDFGEDQAKEYEIEDTEATADFQKTVMDHYRLTHKEAIQKPSF